MNKSNQMTKNSSNLKEISTFLKKDSIISEIQKVLGRKADSFVTSALTAINQNDMLKDADKGTVYGSLMIAASMGLTINPNLGFAYLVPFKNNKKGISECQFQMGYKGFKQLAIRSGEFHNLYAKKVFEGQKIEDNSFLGYYFDWSKKQSDKIIGYASYFRLLNGFESTFFMTTEELQAHGMRFSQSFKNTKTRPYSLWTTDFDKMSLKTVTKLHLNSGEAPLSIEMQKAVLNDQAVIHADQEGETIQVDYADNKTLSIEETKDEQERERVKNFIDQVDSIEKLKEVEDASVQYGLFESYTLKSQELSK